MARRTTLTLSVSGVCAQMVSIDHVFACATTCLETTAAWRLSLPAPGLFLNTNMDFLLDDPLARSYLNVLMIGHCHLMLVILLIVPILILVRHSIPLFIQNCVVTCKLSSYGFQSKLLKWISCWLHGRTQYVKVGRHFSKVCEVFSAWKDSSPI